MKKTPVVLLDVDGVINALTRKPNQAISVCSCDPKYLMSCPRMAQAVLDVARGPS